MEELFNSICISGCAATVLHLAGVAAPEDFAPPIAPILEKYRGLQADRILLYNPDAVALWLYQKYTSMFTDAVAVSDAALPLLSVMPSVTPVCFATMYSGVMPAAHGIKKYTKPVLTVQTVFDRMLAAGKKCAVVSTSGDSISKIFLEREMDYYIYDEPEQVRQKARALIAEDRYDLITIYNGEYDSTMHRHGPEASESMAALRNNIDEYCEYVSLIREKWRRHNTFYGFMPDHGCHEIDGGCGSHGLEMEEDMNIIHFYGFNKKTI